MDQVRATFVVTLFLIPIGYSSAQDHGCTISEKIRARDFTDGEIDHLQQMSAVLWPQDAFKLRDFLANPELQYISASAFYDIVACSSRVSILQSLFPRAKLNIFGIAKITAKIQRSAAERNKGKFDSTCVVPISGVYRKCMNEVMKLPNSYFK